VLSRVLRTIEERALFRPGGRVLVALSGGPDSTALLASLVELGPRWSLTLSAACVDHGLRPESGAEARLVADRAAALGIACEIVRVDLGGARPAHVSLQTAARQARLGALELVASRAGADAVALGHTADDQAETILFRIVRGTGLAGLAGIPYRRPPFVRPLLDVRRAEVLRYLTRRGLPFVDDPSNRDPRFARSRVRHEWLPFLSRENPRLVEALLRLADEARTLGGRTTATSSPALPLYGRAGRTVADLLTRREGTRRVSLPGGTLEVRYGVLRWPAATEPMDRPGAQTAELRVDGPGLYTLPGTRSEAAGILVSDADGGEERDAAVFDADEISWPLQLRGPRPGDRMRPRGGRGSRKLQDLFVDAKIPRAERWGRVVLTAADGEILFVPGLRPAERGRPTSSTRRRLVVRAVESS
jgi:tRNA(Ile)-lysidine synthase